MQENNYNQKNQFLFFSALLLSAFGYEFIYFIMTINIYEISKSALNIGIFTTLTFIPKIFSSLIGGIMDKFGKERCFALSAVSIGILMIFMSFTHNMTVIYIIWFFASVFFTVIINARGTLIAEVFSSKHYSSGNALALSLLNSAKILGPLLGGLISMNLNIIVLLYFTAIVYFLVAASTLRIKTGTAAIADKPNFLLNAKKGFKFMIENKTFGFLTAISFFRQLFLGLQISLFIIYIKTYLNCSSEQYGFFITTIGLGSIAGSLFGSYTAKRIKPFAIITVGLSIHYASFSLLGLCRNYYLSLLIIFISFAIFYMTLVTLHSIRDRITPFEIRGSSYGTSTAVLAPPSIISMLAGSFLADRLNVTTILIFAGALAFLSLHIVLYFGKNTVSNDYKQDDVQQNIA